MGYSEYRVVSLSMPPADEQGSAVAPERLPRHEAVLNELGRQGWELVTITHVPGHDRAATGRNVLVLKRPLRDA